MKTLIKFVMVLVAVSALTACIDQDQGKMQGNKAAQDVVNK